MKNCLMGLGLTLVAACAAATALGAASGPGTQPSQDVMFDPALDSVSKIAPDREIQERLAKMVIGPNMQASTDPMGEGVAALEALRRPHSSYYFVRQLLYYLVRNKPGSDETFFQAIVAPVVMQRLSVDRDATSMLEAIAPFAGAEDADSKFAVDYILRLVEETDRNQRGIASPYQEFLWLCETEKYPLPQAILIQMFMRKPARALLTCETVYTDRREREPILLAGHRVDDYLWTRDFDRKYGRNASVPPDIIETLKTLAKDKEWWPRLYVVGILAENPELRDPALVELLKADTQEMVKKAMAGFDAKIAASGATPARGRSRGEPVIRDLSQFPGGMPPLQPARTRPANP